MKVSTWVPKKQPLPRTLSDVSSSREKPVLCWWNKQTILPCYLNSLGKVCGVTRDGDILWGLLPINHTLYDQTSLQKKLEDVPDRRVIQAGVVDEDVGVVALWFWCGKDWWIARAGDFFTVTRCEEPDLDNWQLTDHVVDLVETEIEVVG